MENWKKRDGMFKFTGSLMENINWMTETLFLKPWLRDFTRKITLTMYHSTVLKRYVLKFNRILDLNRLHLPSEPQQYYLSYNCYYSG